MPLVDILVIVATVGCGVTAGIMLPFSTFLLRTLRALPAAEAMRFMQSINRTIVRGTFMPIFVGTTLLSLAIGVLTIIDGGRVDLVLQLIAAVLYVVGVFGVTSAANVPRNTMLAAATAGTPEGERTWSAFLAGWVPWNHVRTVSATAACAAFTVSLTI